MPRIRDLNIYHSHLPPGPRNAISDVSGVSVGHCTIMEEQQQGGGPFRTGVTLILPHQGNLYEDKVAAAVYRINGFGKYAGLEQIREVGSIETPIALTSTLNMPRVADALMTLAIEQNPHIALGFAESGFQGYNSVNPVVGECNDCFLNDAQSRRVGDAEVRQALANALQSAKTGIVKEGAVGGGTGMSCFEWKGGIGTASRVIPARKGGFIVGALVQSNFGRARELTISGVPVGHFITPPKPQPRTDAGSIMMILATDAPLDGRQLERLCKRASFGLARTGSTCSSGSGDVVIAFSSTYRIPDRPQNVLLDRATLANEQEVISTLGEAVIEAVEEAIYNSLLMAQTVIGRNGNTRHALPVDEVVKLVKKLRVES